MNTKIIEDAENLSSQQMLLRSRLYKSAATRKEILAAYDALMATWQVEYNSRFVTTDFGETHVIQLTPPDTKSIDSIPLVLIPGGQGTAAMWGPVLPLLSVNHRVFSLDLIDQVGYSRPSRILANPEDAALWLAQTLDALGLPKVNLMGNSIGSFIAAQFAIMYPTRVNKLVLTAPAATFAPIRIGYVVSVLLTLLLPFKRVKQSFIAKTANHRGNPDAPLNHLLISSMSGTRVISKLTPSMLSDTDIQSFAPQTLVIFGERDGVNAISGENTMAKLKRINSNFKVEVIAEAGHIFTSADWEFCAEKANEFLGEY